MLSKHYVGISRYDTSQITSNDPLIKGHAEAIVPVPSGSWSFFAVFDGRNGWDKIVWLRENLIHAAIGAMADLYENFAADSSSPQANLLPDHASQAIAKTLKETFNSLNEEIGHVAIQRDAGDFGLASLAFYDSYSRFLHIALTGNTRAVLGRRMENGQKVVFYQVQALSSDKNGDRFSDADVEYLAEPNKKSGSGLGTYPTQMSGDAHYRQDADVQRQIETETEHPNSTILLHVKTPFCLTAEPEVSTVVIQRGDFLVLATDGLWDGLTSEDVIGLVGVWKEENNRRVNDIPTGNEHDIVSTEFLVEGEDHSVGYKRDGIGKCFINVDGNAATHLIRNALGVAGINLDSIPLNPSRKFK